MKKLNLKLKDSKKGITLIALVITIIVLLILAGVSIATLTGENGILTRANEAKTETEEAKEDELRKLTALEAATNIENQPYTDKNGDTATIPADFAVSQVEGENIIKNGLVIIDKNENEFVWVPVDNINKMALTVEGTDLNGNQNYQGKLYDFSSTDVPEMTNYGQNTTNYREPDIIEEYDNDKQNYLNNINLDAYLFQKELKESYNSMIKSVDKYKGFYIGRYETSTNGKEVASKKNVLPMTAEENSGNMWYGLYNKQKNFSISNNLNNVVSGMIWGSQYDIMLIWALEGEENDKVFSTDNAPHNLTNSYCTGTQEKDKINNIYDLEGNVREWTMEALYTNVRVLRGGNFNMSFYPGYRYYDNFPNKLNSNYGSRISLYIK